MQKSFSVQKMTTAALLIALGIVIPMFSFKIVIEPASFTLASHVPVFLAMFISPAVALAVAAGTTLGFFFAGFPIIIVLRAATHMLFAVLGSLYLRHHPSLLSSVGKMQGFSFVIALIHSAGELAVVIPFWFGGGLAAANYESGFVTSVLLLVGVGSVVHSMVDFAIALGIFKILAAQPIFRHLFLQPTAPDALAQ